MPLPHLRRAAAAAFTAALLLAAPARGAGFRGDGSGHFPDARPPLSWSPSRNVAWSTRLPAWGNATPILVGDRLFLTAEPTTLLCVRASDGKLLWSRDVGYLDTVPPDERARAEAERAEAAALANRLAAASRDLDKLRRDARKRDVPPEARARLEGLSREVSAMRLRHDDLRRFRAPESIPVMGTASSTPVSDGRAVYAVFGNFVVAGFTLDGKLLWARYVQPPAQTAMHGYAKGQAASPLIVDGKLIVPLVHLQAFALDTGRTLWESHEFKDYGTPAVARVGGEPVILSADGHATRASDGGNLGKALPFIYYVGPMVERDVAYFAGNVDPNPPNPATATAVRLPARAAEPWKPEILWTAPLPKERQYATPILVDGALVTVDERGALTVIDAATGKVDETRPLGLTSAFPSPTRAGGHLFIGAYDGTTVVLEAKRPFREVARNKLAQGRASPLFHGTRLFIRGEERLYCIEDRAASASGRKPPAKPSRKAAGG